MAWAQLQGSGTEDEPYLIQNATDWATFTSNINSGVGSAAFYQLTSDITLDPLTTIVGKDESNSFQGVFDGDFHTLHINMVRNANYAAPFGITNGATIKNLNVDGDIVTNYKFAAGFVAYAKNTNGKATKIINCISSVHISVYDIVTVVQGKPNDCTHAGLVGQCEKGNIEFENCIFDGWIKDFNTPKKATKCVGFVAWVNDKVIYTNCIMAGVIDVKENNNTLPNSMATFHRLKSASTPAIFDDNTYYINDYTHSSLAKQGKQAYDDVPENVISRQFTSTNGDYYYVPGAQFDESTNTITFYGHTYTNNTDYTYQLQSGDDGINYVYNDGNNSIVKFVERYELETSGDWNDDSNWKYNLVPELGSDVTLKASVTVPDGCVASVKNMVLSTKASIDVAAGAQFLCGNSVEATIHKTIEASTNKDHKWNTLASPVKNLKFDAVENLTSNTHNIYRYDETTPKWEEYRNPDNEYEVFEDGRGYIYRSVNGGDFKFQGSTNEEVTYTVTCTEIKGEKYGVNLIGNPYPHDIYKGVAFPNTNLKKGYCVLSADGEWTYTPDNTAIKSGMAVMIQTTEKQDIVIRNTAEQPIFSKAVNNNIWFTVNNNKYNDVACIDFNEGEGFYKIQHQNEQAPMLYVNHDGRNYASANVDDKTQNISLCFKTKNIGVFNLSVKANGNFSYLHLIDRLTGEDVDLLIDNEYSFVSSDKDNADRFIVKLSYEDNSSVDSNDVFAWQNGNDVIVNGNGELQVFDMTGRMVVSTMVNGVKAVNVQSQNAYIFRMLGDEVKTQKIVVR